MRTPLRDALQAHLDHLSFHTPAHSGVCVFSDDPRFDVTELDFSDNLHAPTGVLAESMAETAAAFGVDFVRYVTAGATAAIHTAILAADGPYLVFGSAHKSVFNGLRLKGAESYVYTARDLPAALEKTRAKTLIVTSPDYYGNCLPLKNIARTAHAFGCTVIVDASHGSHFAFSQKLPVSASEYGDIVIYSLHKTMPVPTGGALIACRAAYAETVSAAFEICHTTSPSYPIMTAIEGAVDLFRREGEALYERVFDALDGFERDLPKPFSIVRAEDRTRLVLTSPYLGTAVADALQRHEIYPECADGSRVTLIVTPFNARHLGRVTEVLRQQRAYPPAEPEPHFPRGMVQLSFGKEFEAVPLSDAIGRIAYREAGLYPPGTPVVYSGEVLSEEKAELLKKWGNRTFGLDCGRILVVK